MLPRQVRHDGGHVPTLEKGRQELERLRIDLNRSRALVLGEQAPLERHHQGVERDAVTTGAGRRADMVIQSRAGDDTLLSSCENVPLGCRAAL